MTFISVSVEFHIMRLISVSSIIVGLHLHCEVKKIGVVGLKRSKKDQRDNLITSIFDGVTCLKHARIFISG